jgi:hypothetical protein
MAADFRAGGLLVKSTVVLLAASLADAFYIPGMQSRLSWFAKILANHFPRLVYQKL